MFRLSNLIIPIKTRVRRAASLGVLAIVTLLAFSAMRPLAVHAKDENTSSVLAARAIFESAFPDWLKLVWPEAQKMGVSRATFEQAMTGLRLNWSLPDLAPLPGVEKEKPLRQAEFQAPHKYFPSAYLGRLAKTGQERRAELIKALRAIEQRFGVPGQILLAIWGRETAFGRAKIPYDAIRSLATLSYVGRRKAYFRRQLLAALLVLEQGHIDRANMKSSWAGALGHTQFLPSEFLIHGVDFDGDGKRDIWTNVPDALATTAKFLQHKGWEKGKPWFYEVKLPLGFDCALEGPLQSRTIAEWAKQGIKRTKNRGFPKHRLEENSFLVLPAGLKGPAFIALNNFLVLKEYNKSDVYALFVGHLADRIANSPEFRGKWQRVGSFNRSTITEFQNNLTKLGIAAGRADGLVGAQTRAAIGRYQKQQGLALDCYPSKALIAHAARAAGDQ